MDNRISPARSAAAYVLSRCRRFDAWSAQTLQTARGKYALNDKDAALCARLCLGVLQNAALCDHYIDLYSSTPSARLDPRVLDILRNETDHALALAKAGKACPEDWKIVVDSVFPRMRNVTVVVDSIRKVEK